jgi:hypothetical protein
MKTYLYVIAFLISTFSVYGAENHIWGRYLLTYKYHNNELAHQAGLIPEHYRADPIDNLGYTVTKEVTFYGEDRSDEDILTSAIAAFDLNEFAELSIQFLEGAKDSEGSSLPIILIAYDEEDNTLEAIQKRRDLWRQRLMQ